MILPAALLLAVATANAASEPAYFTVHVGVNAAPEDSGLEPLTYADDDAARFAAFTAPLAKAQVLVTTPDESTQARFPAAAKAVPPTKKSLTKALRALSFEMQKAQKAGRRVVLLFSYSGHGVLTEEGTRLALLDATIDQEYLAEELLALPAERVHLFIDACHAGALLKGRGDRVIGGERLSLRDADAAWGRKFFMRHPHVGVTVATSADGLAHEWSRLEAGVFTYEVLSGLAGGADINVDGNVTYGELAAFVAAANRGIKDPRGRVKLHIEPPRQDQKSPIIELGWMRRSPVLVGTAPSAGHITVEREDGLRVLDVNYGGGSHLVVRLPAKGRYFIRYQDGEVASVRLLPDEVLFLSELEFTTGDKVAKRGTLDAAMRDGFFARPFSRSYYDGYVDSKGLLPEHFNTKSWIEKRGFVFSDGGKARRSSSSRKSAKRRTASAPGEPAPKPKATASEAPKAKRKTTKRAEANKEAPAAAAGEETAFVWPSVPTVLIGVATTACAGLALTACAGSALNWAAWAGTDYPRPAADYSWTAMWMGGCATVLTGITGVCGAAFVNSSLDDLPQEEPPPEKKKKRKKKRRCSEAAQSSRQAMTF